MGLYVWMKWCERISKEYPPKKEEAIIKMDDCLFFLLKNY